MAEVPLQRQFMGQAQLVRLLLWRIGGSTDIDACLHVAGEAGMLTAADAAFLRECLDAEERQRALGGAGAPGKGKGRPAAPVEAAGSTKATDPAEAAATASVIAEGTLAGAEAPAGLSIDEQLIARLRRCADKLNRADAA